MPRGKARDLGCAATADMVLTALFKAMDGITPKDPRLLRILCPTDADKALAAKALEWARALPEAAENDYLHNLRLVCCADHVTERTAGIAASAVSAYQRYMAEQAERQAVQPSPFKAGDKLGRKLTKKDRDTGATAHPAQVGLVTMLKHLEFSCLIKVQTDAGQVLTWFASNLGQDLAVGDRVEVVATVKRCETYRGEPQTILTRADIHICK